MTEVMNKPGADRPVAVPPEGRKHYLAEHPFNVVRSPLPDSVTCAEVMIEMRDGVKLAANLFLPRQIDGPLPTIVTATPYGKDNYDQWEHFADPPVGNVPGGGFYMGTLHISDHTPFEAPDPGWWVPRGYAVMLVDHPGLGHSGSNPETSPGPEARWQDTMAWIGRQSWSNGRVGMSGVSALCATQWIAAKSPAPAELKAIIAWEGFNETGPGNGYGGIPDTAFPVWLRDVWIGPNVNRSASGLEAMIFDWKHDTASIEVPALICGSFSDQELHSWDSFDAFTKLATDQKWLYGHRRQKWGAYYGEEELALQKRFLDHFLKGEGDLADVPKVRLEINSDRDSFEVRTASDWPLPGTRYQTFYPDAATGALQAQPVASEGQVTIAPQPECDPDNRAVFDLTFEADTEITGHGALHLTIEAQDTDEVDLFVGVEKLDAEGSKLYFFSASGGNANGPVTRGWLRASCRALDEAASTEFRPVRKLGVTQPLPDGRFGVSIPLMPTGTQFRAGETLRLVVQSWSKPGQWEGGETREWAATQTGRCVIHTGGPHVSRLVLPLIG